MLRHALAAALLTTTAFAAIIDPGRTTALALLLDGLPGGLNEVAKAPTVSVKLRDAALTLEEAKLADVQKLLGGEINQTGESENGFAWLCYASPDANSGGATLTWFYAVDATALNLSGIAQEFAPDEFTDACLRLDKAIDLTTGLPGLGAPLADLGKVYGEASNDSGVPGTVGYIFGNAPAGDGLTARTEAKYVYGDEHILAFSVMAVIDGPE